MSVPPPGEKYPAAEGYHQPLNAAKEEIEKAPDPSQETFIRVTPAIHRALHDSIDCRIEKLKQLPPAIALKINKLEKMLEQLEPLCLENCKLKLKLDALTDKLLDLSSDEENHEVVQRERNDVDAQIDALNMPIEAIEKSMTSVITDFLSENKELKITKEWFSDWWKVDSIDGYKQDISLRFTKEQMLNRCVDQLCFLKDARVAIEKNKPLIVETFCRQDASISNPEQVAFELFPHGAETHNRGKVPIKISFQLNGSELFSVFFKPRDAQIDAKVIEVFRSLNQLPAEQRSLNIDLPNYRIINLTHQGHPFSLWEFIDGQHLNGQTANDVIQTFPNTPEKDRLVLQLSRLESVCKFLNISDLHLENIIFFHLGHDDSKIFLIDLESLQPGMSTGLFTHDPEIPPFTRKEQELLEACKEGLNEVYARFVPIPTSHFLAGLTRCDSFTMMADFVVESIQKKGYSLSIPKEELEWMILTDFLHNDVPYLTEYKSNIYYVFAGEPIKITRR